MTEEEARTKLCVNSAPNWVSSNEGVHPTSACLGSACMAWRWIKQPNEGQPLGKPRTAGEGFCGLAGKP